MKRLTQGFLIALVIICSGSYVWRFRGRYDALSIQSDPRRYFYYALSVAQAGPAVFPRLFEQYLNNVQIEQYAPSPIRIATSLIQSIGILILGSTPESLQYVSLCAFLSFLVLLWLAIKRIAEPEVSLWTTVLVAFAPLHTAIATRPAGDILASFAFLFSFWLFIEVIFKDSIKKYGWFWVGFSYTLSVLIKESNLLLIPVSSVLFMLFLNELRASKTWSFLISCCILPVVFSSVFIAIAAGGIEPAWQTFWISINSPKTNPYALLWCKGPWFRYIVDFTLISPGVLLLYLMWLGCLASVKEINERIIAWSILPIFFVVFTAPFLKHIRYAVALEVPMRFCSVLFLKNVLWQHMKPKTAILTFCSVVLMLVIWDVSMFCGFFGFKTDTFWNTLTLMKFWNFGKW